MNVFSALVGQDEAVEVLAKAAAAANRIVASGRAQTAADSPASVDAYVAPDSYASLADMTHAWLFTGPAGSGRSVAARAFAAALQCEHGTGCGDCAGCHTVLAGTHADLRLVVPEGLSISVAEVRALVLRAASAPANGRWQVVLVEDADRLGESASNALLKAVEEPPQRTVFLLCAPSTHPDDVAVTIRSRCRLVTLRSPAPEAVAEVLIKRDGVDDATALWAARASQGHVGRARRLARDPDSQQRRRDVLAVPRSLTSVAACFTAAEKLVASVEAQAQAALTGVAEKEIAELKQALGAGGTGKGTATASRGTAGMVKELEKRQKSRVTRAQRDALDRALVDLAAFYRDVLARRFESGVAPVHPDVTELAASASAVWTPESVLHRIDAVLACREAIDANVKPLIAVEQLMLALYRG